MTEIKIESSIPPCSMTVYESTKEPKIEIKTQTKYKERERDNSEQLSGKRLINFNFHPRLSKKKKERNQKTL